MGMPSLQIRMHVVSLLDRAMPRPGLWCVGTFLGLLFGFFTVWTNLPAASPARKPAARSAILQPPHDSLIQITVLAGSAAPEAPRFRDAALAAAFNERLAQAPAAQKYFDGLAYLGPSEDATTVRMGFTVELLSELVSDPDLRARVNTELRRHASGAMRVIEGNLPLLQKDFFTEQLVLPMVHQLAVSNERKAVVYGRILDRPFTVDAKGMLTPRSATLTSALIYLEETRLPADRIWPHLKHALQRTSGDPQAYGILEARIAASFPGIQRSN